MDEIPEYTNLSDFGFKLSVVDAEDQKWQIEIYHPIEMGKEYIYVLGDEEEHPEWFLLNASQKEYFDESVYEERSISSHIYGVDEIVFEKMEMDTKKVDWETFTSGDYAIVSTPLTSGGNDSEYAYYQVGEKLAVTLPDGSSRDYEIIGIGDVSYAMGPQHSHGMDINITISGSEYQKAFPDTKGALRYFVNVNDENMDVVESFVADYCENIKPELTFTSRMTYLKEFKETIRTYLIIGGALSAVLALIGILNLINLTYSFIHERKQELKVLSAIGMTRGQMSAMLSYEGIYRVMLTFSLTLTLG